MIPRNITKNHILIAIKTIIKGGILKGHESRKYNLFYEGKTYPPKYIVALANQFANGELLESSEFSGGKETNDFLKRLGFEISSESQNRTTTIKSKNKIFVKSQNYQSHNERCPICKQTIERMLRKIYGNVICNYKFESGVRPENFIKSDYYKILIDIYSSLQKFRGHYNFIKTTNLPRFDFYVPNLGVIIEFDESQHFTSCRKQTLLQYPVALKTGFVPQKWINLCDEISAKDNDPVYRDEQRAWYDTLRDFLPSIEQLRPTIRLYSRDLKWCDLNPKVESDIDKFKSLIKEKRASEEIEVKADFNPTLARIVIAGDWKGDFNSSRNVLNRICDIWPQDKKVDCLITCGAFLRFDIPDSITNIGDPKFPNQNEFARITSLAKKQCQNLLDDELRKRLKKFTDYITIGVDSKKDKISISSVSIRELHTEMVVLFDLNTNKYFLTGKSYPTVGQENGLVRFQDLKTHIIKLPIGKVMILGCHDLNAFNPRGRANVTKEWRKQVNESFHDLVKKEQPDLVLHHPHTTDSSKIWTSAWNELIRLTPNIKRYLSAGRFYNDKGTPRSLLSDVLEKTKHGKTVDFIINIHEIGN
jgi:hypothetical protein